MGDEQVRLHGIFCEVLRLENWECEANSEVDDSLELKICVIIAVFLCFF